MKEVDKMFDFFIETYREVVKGEDVEIEKKLKREEEKAKKIIYPKDIKIVTYILAIMYLVTAVASSTLTIIYRGIVFSVITTFILAIIDILIIFFLSRKTKQGEITAIILTIIFAIGLYGSTILNTLFV